LFDDICRCIRTIPKLRVAFAHGGGSFPFTLGRIEHGFKVRPDLVAIDNPVNPKNYIGKFWIDSLVHDKKTFEYLLDVMGEDNICLGSDYPFPLGEHHPGKLIEKMDLGKKNNKEIIIQECPRLARIEREIRSRILMFSTEVSPLLDLLPLYHLQNLI